MVCLRAKPTYVWKWIGWSAPGVVVVVAAGNSGYGVLSTEFTGLRRRE